MDYEMKTKNDFNILLQEIEFEFWCFFYFLEIETFRIY